MKFWVALLGSAFAVQAAAATPATVDELAVIRSFETAKLDKAGLRRAGDDVRFDVTVTRRDPAQRPQGEPASRQLRYLGKCKERNLRLSSVTTHDEYGKMIKHYVVPPGSAEFSSPPAGSPAAEWIAQACRD